MGQQSWNWRPRITHPYQKSTNSVEKNYSTDIQEFCCDIHDYIFVEESNCRISWQLMKKRDSVMIALLGLVCFYHMGSLHLRSQVKPNTLTLFISGHMHKAMKITKCSVTNCSEFSSVIPQWNTNTLNIDIPSSSLIKQNNRKMDKFLQRLNPAERRASCLRGENWGGM